MWSFVFLLLWMVLLELHLGILIELQKVTFMVFKKNFLTSLRRLALFLLTYLFLWCKLIPVRYHDSSSFAAAGITSWATLSAFCYDDYETLLWTCEYFSRLIYIKVTYMNDLRLNGSSESPASHKESILRYSI